MRPPQITPKSPDVYSLRLNFKVLWGAFQVAGCFGGRLGAPGQCLGSLIACAWITLVAAVPCRFSCPGDACGAMPFIQLDIA